MLIFRVVVLFQGLVFVQGSVMMEAATKDELWSIFEKGSENRHVASTSKGKKTNFHHVARIQKVIQELITVLIYHQIVWN